MNFFKKIFGRSTAKPSPSKELSPIAELVKKYGVPPAPKKGENVNSDLLTASYEGDGEAVGVLIAKGADVNAVRKVYDAKGAWRFRGEVTPLYAACHMLHPEVVQLLLEAKANVNTKSVSQQGRTALIAACDGFVGGCANHYGAEQMAALRPRQLSVVKLLIAAGAAVNAKDQFGATALEHIYWRTEPWAIELQNLLKEAGASRSKA